MIQFWSERSVRERTLLVAAAIIICLLVVSAFVVRPLRVAQTQVRLDVLAASSTLELVDLAAQSARAGVDAQARSPAVELRTALVELARTRGIEISRLQTREDGGIVLQIENAPAPLIYAWLIEAEQRFNAVPVRVALLEDATGTVRASLEFDSGQP